MAIWGRGKLGAGRHGSWKELLTILELNSHRLIGALH